MNTDQAHSRTSRKGFITNLEPSRRGFITNYPNFQHWKKTTAEEMTAGEPLNIYVHIPFCAQQCSYCYYRTVKGTRKSEVDRYVNALCREIELTSAYFGLKERPVVSVYFGGGTPTLVTGENLTQIIETLHKNLNIVDGYEFTVEGEPVTLIQKKADALKELGVTRISLGAQSLADEIIKLSGRQDTEAKILKAVDIARSTGAIVNLDLMSGLAGETPETWAYTIKRAIEIGLESITVYKMELYANTQYYQDVRKNNLKLPTDEEELELMRYAMEQFEKARYFPWGFITFTKEGRYEHVHSPRIWRGEDFYPYGTSAFGRLGNWLFQNTNEIEKYISRLESGEVPISRGHHLSTLEEMVRGLVLEMKLIRMDLKKFRERYGFTLASLCGPAMKQLESEGFITFSEDELTLTSKGILHGDYVGKSLGKFLVESQM
uniref:Oxygen-independent coproporphyrinogen-3 oxidase n=1 Tax=Candidatus Kentrum sp. FM TaxID=2126340 RepID=A0A450T8F1_9GAMM|nr:MAG: oxygen-independent coproporphyrinogen-3 oxidase [Candidatus Kentron sp. FM]VFJ64275.1 MAG: oxygen-independent coproporphyrinogen-3 oxidase [Candidatus Kentron sp. FM]VFK13986.1 MAG: oxygen-independent coproporphyrinogen-3 oxidase [Candidatus Kentron sp. FM]